MTLFRVWAPLAHRVELALAGRRRAMTRVALTVEDAGWWSVDVPAAAPETDYAYELDGEGPFPDPRSPWQPIGVDAASRTVDHSDFQWQHDDWPAVALADAVIYELHIGTFTPGGSFDSAIERLDHLVELGVTHVEVMPVAHFSGERGWGYDGVDLYAPHETYGGPAGLKRFVDACHGHGLRVLMDVVYNHLGPAGNYTERFGPYFTERYHTPWGKAVNYDQAYADEVRRYVVDNALMWLSDYRFDGLRLDAVHAILDQSAVHILEQLGAETRGLEHKTGRRYDLIAESDLNDPRLVREAEHGGYGLDGAWSDDFHHALHALLTGESAGYYADFGRIAHLAAALERMYVYNGVYSAYRQRSHGRPLGDVPATRFVIAAQNHDQVGNRARGERLEHIAGTRRARIAAAVLLLAPGVPLLFQGEEWAATSPFQYFTAHGDPALARAVSEGRRREFVTFGWEPSSVPDPQDVATFERSRLNWAELEFTELEPTPSGERLDRTRHTEMLAWYRDLIRLRRTSPELRHGDLATVHVTFDEDDRWLTMTRGRLTMALNLASQPCTVRVPNGVTLELASEDAVTFQETFLTLPPDSVAVVGASA